MPIKEDYKLWCTGGSIKEGVSEWRFSDTDQRRLIAVRMDEEQDSEDVALEHLKKYIDNLDPDITLVHIGLDGDLISVSSDPVHDETFYMYYPPLDLVERPAGVQIILRSELRELDRLIGNVDLVSYQTDSNPPETRRVVFKYYWQLQFLEKIWEEMNLWMRLSHHPNIVPFDRLVLDEVRGGVVGFTTLYIPGGTLQDNVSRPFKLKWCKQLMHLVDDLNLRYGIAHQDVVPRNLVVDEATDNLMLFDFDWSAQIGRRRGPSFFSYWDVRDDVRAVIFTVYEMITRDFHFREADWEALDVATIQDVEWAQHPDVTLDHPVAEYRALLNAWVKTREEGKQVTVYTDAPEYIDWPILEKQVIETPLPDGSVQQVLAWDMVLRSTALARGEVFAEWQRPRQSALKGDYHLLASGELVD